MKFTTLTLLVLVTVIQLSPTLIRATMVEGPTGDVTCNPMDVIVPCLLPLTNSKILPTPHCCQVMFMMMQHITINIRKVFIVSSETVAMVSRSAMVLLRGNLAIGGL
ncbi:unnamed protein product [Arabidopsis thaliana]|uniref:Bifunctional inhibitor/plant lipid transfer protein/seed storage helical domain-containing protein n=1 Tax=Arabidopsis thaliana TaxID=3702 RepID=Q9LVP3_ARATH|nr:unnamed protein product [Arabidopsis thaliana]